MGIHEPGRQFLCEIAMQGQAISIIRFAKLLEGSGMQLIWGFLKRGVCTGPVRGVFFVPR